MNSKTMICTHCNSVIQDGDDAFYVDGELAPPVRLTITARATVGAAQKRARKAL